MRSTSKGSPRKCFEAPWYSRSSTEFMHRWSRICLSFSTPFLTAAILDHVASSQIPRRDDAKTSDCVPIANMVHRPRRVP